MVKFSSTEGETAVKDTPEKTSFVISMQRTSKEAESSMVLRDMPPGCDRIPHASEREDNIRNGN